MSEMLSKEELLEYKNLIKSKYIIEEKIVDRIGNILSYILCLFDYDITVNWYFDGAKEGEMGEVEISYEKGKPAFISNIIITNVIDKKDFFYFWQYFLNETIPVNYLYSDEYKEELEAYVKKFEDDKKKKKDKQKEYYKIKKEIDLELKKERKNKLKIMKELK